MRERRKETTKGQRRRKGSWKIKGKKKKKKKKIMREQQLKMKCNIVSDCKNRQTGEKGENSKRHFLQRSCVTDVTTVEEE